MAIMPLIITSLTEAVINVGGRRDLGILGGKTFVYYITSSLLAILTGQALVNLGLITKQDALAKAQDKNAFGAMGRI